MGESKYVIFKLGQESYGIDISYVSAIEKIINIIPVPNAPKHIEGIINLRGDIIPVYNLRHKFNMPTGVVDDNTKLIIIKMEAMLVALQVDGVEEISMFDDENLKETPQLLKDTTTSYISQVAHRDGNMTIIINIEGLLSQTEQDSLEVFLDSYAE